MDVQRICYGHKGFHQNTPLAFFEATDVRLLHLSNFCKLHLGEAELLESVEKSSGRLQIVQVKTGRRRWVVLSEATRAAIRAWAQPGLIWPRVRVDRVTREIQAAAKACGLEKLTHTDLRRSAIRSVEEQQAGSGWIFAGHESDSTTRQWYLPKDLVYDSLPRPRF